MRELPNQSCHDNVWDHRCKATKYRKWSSTHSINNEEADADCHKLPDVQNARDNQRHLVIKSERGKENWCIVDEAVDSGELDNVSQPTITE